MFVQFIRLLLTANRGEVWIVIVGVNVVILVDEIVAKTPGVGVRCVGAKESPVTFAAFSSAFYSQFPFTLRPHFHPSDPPMSQCSIPCHQHKSVSPALDSHVYDLLRGDAGTSVCDCTIW